MSSLVPCPGCSRHVRRTETICPFCGGGVAAAMAQAPERVLPTTRLGRAALYAFAAASVGTAACSSDAPTGSSRGPVAGDAATGGGGGASSSTGGAGSGGEMAVPIYGAPFPTGGKTGAGGNVGTGGGNVGTGGEFAVPLYGLPAYAGGAPGAADGGAQDAAQGGGFSALYGAPPKG